MRMGPSSLVIVGEAGIGKTTLWLHGIGRAEERGALVAISRPTEEEFRSPASGLVDLIERGGRSRSDVPEALYAPDTPSSERGRLTLQVLRDLASVGPVLVAVDDLHWLDEPTARALVFAMDRLDREPMRMIATCRSWDTSDRLIAPRLPRQSGLLGVGPMPAAPLRRVLSATLSSISKPAFDRIYELSHGNPFVALELVWRWANNRTGSLEDLVVAEPTDRIRQLSADATEVVQVLSLSGPVSAGLLEQVVELDRFDGALRAAVDAGIVRVEHDFTLRFTHSLYAAAVLRTMNPLDRRSIHARLAELVVHADARVRHLALATVGPDEATAEKAEAAAARCPRHGLAQLAAEMAAHSARLTPPEHVEDSARRSMLEVSGRAAAGEPARAIELVDSLMAGLPDGRLRAMAMTQRVFLDFGDSERILRSALADANRDPSLRARILDLLGWQLGLYRGQLDSGLSCSLEAYELAHSQGDRELAALAASAAGSISSLRGEPRADLLDEAVELASEAEPQPLGRWPEVFRARCQLWDGRLDDARRVFELMRRRATMIGSEFQRPYRLFDLAMVELAAGDLPAAVQMATDGLDSARDAHNDQAVVWLAQPFGLARALQGSRADADWAADQLTDWGFEHDEPPRIAVAEEVRGSLSATLGDWGAALAAFERAVDRLDEMGIRHPGAYTAPVRAIAAAAMTGHAERAHHWSERLASLAGGLDAPWVDAQVFVAGGQVALVDRSSDRAVEQLVEGVAALERTGHRFDAARARLFLARALRLAGRRRASTDVLEAARLVFDAAQSPGWRVAAERELRSLGAASELTPTEARVVALVATGVTNREIAAELFMSVSTVEAHLTRVYRKLGLRGRAALTRWASSSHADQLDP